MLLLGFFFIFVFLQFLFEFSVCTAWMWRYLYEWQSQVFLELLKIFEAFAPLSVYFNSVWPEWLTFSPITYVGFKH